MRYSILFLLALAVAVALAEYRSHDGSGNNAANPTWGKSNLPMSRILPAHYPNGVQAAPVAPVHPRTASNIFASDTSYPKNDALYTKEERITGLNPSPNRVNMLAVEMMQFVLHDLSELFVDFGVQNIMANFGFRTNNPNDPLYEQNPPPGFTDPRITRNYPRDLFLVFTPFGQNVSGVHQGVNRVTSFLDLSQVYGTDDSINTKLRSLVDGKMKINADGYLPKSSEVGVRSQCGGFGGDAFGAGDPRIDTTQKQVALHTFMVRKHNKIAEALKRRNPSWNDEKLYQEARRRLIAIYQHIVYDDLLPVFIGHEMSQFFIGHYDGYDSSVDPTISHEFAIAFSRVMGHISVNLPALNLLYANCTSVRAPGTDDGYNNENDLEHYYAERFSCAFDFTKLMGLDNAIRSAMVQFARNPRKAGLVNIMRNGKSKGSTPGNLDIFMNDIIRHRQFGVPSFYQLVKHIRNVDIHRLPGCNTETDSQGERDTLICFLYITGNASRAFDLQYHYRKVENIDANVGFMVEWDRTSSGMPMTAAVGYAKEFKKIRKADRFFYKNGQFTAHEIREIERESLASIIRDVSGLPRNAIPDDVFHVVDAHERRRLCPAE